MIRLHSLQGLPYLATTTQVLMKNKIKDSLSLKRLEINRYQDWRHNRNGETILSTIEKCKSPGHLLMVSYAVVPPNFICLEDRSQLPPILSV